MTILKKSTDKSHQHKLESQIVNADWNRDFAAVGEKVTYRVDTRYVKGGSKIELKFAAKKGGAVKVKYRPWLKKDGKWVQSEKYEESNILKGEVWGDRFHGWILVPEKAKEALTYEVKIGDGYSLSQKSTELSLQPPRTLSKAKWLDSEGTELKELHRDQIVTLSVEQTGLLEDMSVEFHVRELDELAGPKVITLLIGTVSSGKAQAKWLFEYKKKTEDIPTTDYTNPAYDFVAKVGKTEHVAPTIPFKDFIRIRFLNGSDKIKMEFKKPDGSTEKAQADSVEYTLNSTPPGPHQIKLTKES